MRLKRKFAIRIQGLALIMLGALCHQTGADGAMIFMELCGASMLIGKTNWR